MSKVKTYSDVLSNKEMELLIKYLTEKIPVVRKVKEELAALLKSGDITDNHELREIKCCIGEYSHDICYYNKLISKIKNNEICSPNDAMELWCMCDNKENFDKIHNELHNQIITKLKAIR